MADSAADQSNPADSAHLAGLASPGAPRLRGRTADAVLAALTAVVAIAGSVFPERDTEITPVGWLVLILTCAALYFRRAYPLAVTLVTLAGTAAYLLMPDPDGPVIIAFAIALYTLMATGRFAVGALLAAVVIVASFYGEYSTDTENLGELGVLFFAGWLLSVMAIGGAVYNRRAYLREVERRLRESELNRVAELERHTTEERLQIARELHDVLGHTISLIHVQAGAALHRMGKDTSQAEEALSAIKASSQEALRELRATLGVLRQVDEAAPTTPAPRLSRVHEVIERTRSSDLDVHAEIQGEPPAWLPSAVDVAGYRIVQEALTNVTRHADASTAIVRVRFGSEAVVIEVLDDGRGGTRQAGSTPDGTGVGIIGMTERAASVAGELNAGPRAEGGFRVHARLPYGTPPAERGAEEST
ncbi:sensor histidine kinase [Phytoactinopolyspora alkaliphila]|uniref:histidine kinase n=1 Tax=Phytoactinopolyspora alkaliphila TaxID=1783498 RepID=A0A6N9YR81_9ACTN|nr:sensor histidine kinase [Phytoactinopolyspora alkaliphila]NED97566.1 sensor histidine kinase [Phytoactinopolyspora alkaliphila]